MSIPERAIVRMSCEFLRVLLRQSCWSYKNVHVGERFGRSCLFDRRALTSGHGRGGTVKACYVAYSG